MATRRNADQVEEGRAFFRALAETPLAPVYLITGEERFLVDSAVRRIVELAFPGGRDDFNLASYHGSETTGTTVVGAASQAPMFAARRVVVVRGVEALSPTELGIVADYAENPAQTSVLVLEGLKLDLRQKNSKRLQTAAGAAAIELVSLPPRDAAAWVARQAKRRGLALDGDVGGHLVDAVGTSLADLDLALERVALYVGARARASLSDAEAVVPDTRTRSVFDLVDHLASRRLADATACFHRLLDQGESPIGALAMIARQFRQLTVAREVGGAGLSDRDAAAAIGCPPFKVRDYVTASRAFPDEALPRILGEIAATDLALKSSRVRRELLVERLFVRICAPAR
ncbi:MAG: DNA polymerase III subunit delta [Myxococcales bacterium]|nr:DNA polymerase III subunit delta [Myxococcales bacterium]MCB9519314.1 DNA polymerase III subunit delta [Myxococcales bacterium]MCB9530758.1 DNA polymerase III subunit delta [Myxococcales bacterium]MCB9533348.1 DNA polymerase III subunit delta [Myxococcales bacterium]